MQTANVPTDRVRKTTSASAEETLDSLARRSFAELDALYGRLPAPSSLRDADGTPKGRMLAVRGVDSSPLARYLRAFAASPSFVWDGKSFSSISDQEGRGINRVQIPWALGRQNLFPFETRLGRSSFDDGYALILNYDLPENPPWVRSVHDEVREVSSGLYFGPAMWKTAKGVTTVLWFALDARKR
jgi:hypothetical protein